MVYVYVADCTNLPDPIEEPDVMDGLSEKRKNKILKYKHRKDRKLSLGAGLLLKCVLEKFGRSESEVCVDENGKPMLEGLYFNLAHSGEMVALAVGEVPVGCDIEKIEAARMMIARKCFCDSENEYLQQFEGLDLDEAFYRLWTMKESYVKMTGAGLRTPLNQIEFVMRDEVTVAEGGKPIECHVREYEVPEYKLTVCAKDKEFSEIQRIVFGGNEYNLLAKNAQINYTIR